jgi:hypothetical protein
MIERVDARLTSHAVGTEESLHLLSGGLRPPDPLTRSLARRFAGALRFAWLASLRSLASFYHQLVI